MYVGVKITAKREPEHAVRRRHHKTKFTAGYVCHGRHSSPPTCESCPANHNLA